jgi:hypothetical protein
VENKTKTQFVGAFLLSNHMDDHALKKARNETKQNGASFYIIFYFFPAAAAAAAAQSGEKESTEKKKNVACNSMGQIMHGFRGEKKERVPESLFKARCQPVNMRLFVTRPPRSTQQQQQQR